MKYYCKNCGSILEVGCDVTLSINPDGKELVECPICTDFYDGECEPVFMEKIPDYETPERYEKRTGKAYPDKGLVFVSFLGHWLVKDDKPKEGYLHHYATVVIADPPVPPPDDWRPE